MTAARALTSTLNAEDLIGQAHAAMGVGAVETALEGVAQVRQRVQAGAVTPLDVAQAITSELMAGVPATDDMADRLADAAVAAERHDAVLGWLDHVRASLSSAVDTTRAAKLDDGLDVLRPRLVALLDEARPAVAALGSATTADEAVTAHVEDAWREVVRLAADHDTIRSVQRRLIGDSSSRADRRTDVLDLYGYVREPERYADVARYAELQIDHVRLTHPLTGAAVDGPVLPWLHGRPVDRLRFACREDVEPWCPSWRDMVAARDASRVARSEVAQQSSDQDAPRPSAIHHRVAGWFA